MVRADRYTVARFENGMRPDTDIDLAGLSVPEKEFYKAIFFQVMIQTILHRFAAFAGSHAASEVFEVTVAGPADRVHLPGK